MISEFTRSTVPRLIFGPGTIGRLGEIVAPFGRSALLVTGSEALERSDSWKGSVNEPSWVIPFLWWRPPPWGQAARPPFFPACAN